MKTTSPQKRRLRQNRIRARVTGTAARPRLNVHRSLLHTFAQLVDDVTGRTLVSVHSKTLGKVAPTEVGAGELKGKSAEAFVVGKKIAELAAAAKITSIVFDRAGYRYHGRVKAVADGARAGGLQF